MTYMEIEAFRSILRLALPGRLPFNTLHWKPLVNLVLFIHRVRGLKSGLYIFLRDDDVESRERLKEAVSPRFSWSGPEGWDTEDKDLEQYLLEEGDARGAARGTSCDQDIASDGCFCLAMLAEFEKPLRDLGPWFYPRLHWECGMIGQAMYLGSEVLGLRGCGIGCFLDDTVHRLLGLEGFQYQDLYHFTLGKALEDKRITTIPAYT
jgi:nitroreductase